MNEKYYEVIDRVGAYISEHELNKTRMAGLLGVDRTSFSQFLNEDEGLSEKTCEKIAEAFERLLRGEKIKKQLDRERRHEIIKTKDANGVLAICQFCKANCGLGIVFGASGYGKTFALKYFARSPRTAYIECNESMNSKDLLKAIERALSLPRGTGSVDDRLDGIKDFFNANPGYLLIIDEADKLITKYTQKKAEILRSIFDDSDVGLVLAGEPALAKTIKIHIPRLANRIDMGHELTGPESGDIHEYLSQFEEFEFTPEAQDELVRRATNKRNGCFRLFVRTVNNVLRMQDGGVVDVDDIENACNMMII